MCYNVLFLTKEKNRHHTLKVKWLLTLLENWQVNMELAISQKPWRSMYMKIWIVQFN